MESVCVCAGEAVRVRESRRGLWGYEMTLKVQSQPKCANKWVLTLLGGLLHGLRG